MNEDKIDLLATAFAAGFTAGRDMNGDATNEVETCRKNFRLFVDELTVLKKAKKAAKRRAKEKAAQ